MPRASFEGDHGTLTGLTDDDHTQYVKDAGDTMSGNLTFDNGKGIFGKDTNGTAKSLIYMSNGNQVVLGPGTANILNVDCNYLEIGNRRITSLGAPTAATDAARVQDAMMWSIVLG